MRIHTIHRRYPGLLQEPELRAVKEGFCWPALLFGPVWAAWRGHWLLAAGLLALAVAAALLPGPVWLTLPAQLFLWLLVGFEGNDLARWSLARRGFATVGAAAGRSRATAMAAFAAGARA